MIDSRIIKVNIVEDDNEIRQLLEIVIDRTPGFVCSDVFKDAESAMPTILATKPDVVLMDIELPGITGIECIKILKEKLPDTDFIMLTIHEDEEAIFNSLTAGATGYLLKDTPPSTLLAAIVEVYEGGSPSTPSIARKITQSFQANMQNPLSVRETEILEKLCSGEGYSSIAEQLFISGHTVRAHIKNIYKKLHVNSRAQAVKTAIKNNLIR